MTTYGEWFNSALACKTEEEASKWISNEVRRYELEHGKDKAKALSQIRNDLGYMAGYYDKPVAEKIFRLFGAVHPIWGKAK